MSKIVDTLPIAKMGFVLDEMMGAVTEIARHRYGCRVISRLVERSGEFAQQNRKVEAVMSEMLDEAAELSRHTFGHYVIEAVLQHGTPEDVRKVCNALRSELLRNAKNRCATYVVEKALMCCDEDMQRTLVHELFASADVLVALVDNQFGCHVAKALVRFPGDHAQHIMQTVQVSRERLQKTKYGRRLLEEFNHQRSKK